MEEMCWILGGCFYEKDMMVSKVLCPDKEIDEDTVQPVCTSPTTPEGAVTGSCCGVGGAAYVISYRKLDARWLNRLTNAVSSDFMWIFATQDYRNNVGVITWSEKAKLGNLSAKSIWWRFIAKTGRNFCRRIREHLILCIRGRR